jgi:hypothetical protein
MMRRAVPSALLALGAALAVSADDCGGGVTWCASYAPSGGETFSVPTTVQGQASPPNAVSPVTPDGPLPEALTLFTSTVEGATYPLSFAFQLAAADGSSPQGWFVCTIEPVPDNDEGDDDDGGAFPPGGLPAWLFDDDEATAYCQQTFKAADNTTIVYNLVLDLDDDDDNDLDQCNVKAVAAVGMALPSSSGDSATKGPYTWWVKKCS